MFGSRHSCLEFHVGVRTLELHVLSLLCEREVSSLLGRALFCPRVVFCVARGSCSAAYFSCHLVLLHAVRVFIGCMHSCYVLCCVARSLCFSFAVCFHVVASCVNTWLMSILISCVFVSCFAGHVLVFLFCVNTWLLS